MNQNTSTLTKLTPSAQKRIADNDNPFQAAAKGLWELAGEDWPDDLPPADEPDDRIYDAEIWGTLTDEIANLPIVLSTAKNRDAREWTTHPEKPFIELFKTVFSKHLVGKKDGNSIVTGSLGKSKRRTKQNVLANYLMGLDVDCGASMEETFQRVRAKGLTAIFYTTFNFGTTEVELAYDKFYRWAIKAELPAEPNTDVIRRYMREETNYVPNVCDSDEFVKKAHEDGMKIIVRTRPIDKFRILFPLAEAFVYAKQPGALKDVIQTWESKVLGMGRTLGIEIDRVARDPSRLFYLPRHGKDSTNHRIMLTCGQLLRIEDIRPANPRERVSDDPFDRAAYALGGSSGKAHAGDVNLKQWVRERAAGFDIASLFRDHCDDRVRETQSQDKLTVECPWDEDHSNPGNPEDKGTFVQSAGMDAESFAFHCSHQGCAGRDRLDMMAKAIELEWFPADALWDDAYFDDPDGGGENKSESADEEVGPIYRADDFPDQCGAVRRALQRRNNPPSMLRHGGVLKRVVEMGGRAKLKPMTQPNLKNAANESITCFKEYPKKKGERVRKVSLPEDVISHIWGEDGEWAPEVHRIMQVPIVSRQGTIRTKHGYDDETETFIDIPDIGSLNIPDAPTREDVDSALALLSEAYCDFPFTDSWSGDVAANDGHASRANFLALVLTPFVRDLYKGPTPFFLFDKPTIGTGAGLLADVLCTIITGEPAAPQAFPKNDEELGKVITAKMSGGGPLLMFDNVTRMLAGDNLAVLGTASRWEGRILCASELYDGPIRCVTLFTGNNVKLSDENVRRIIPIRLDAHSQYPAEGRTFLHDPLQPWLEKNRAALVRACLVVIRYWVSEGMKPDTSAALGSYSSYVQTMGGILKAAGVTGFLGNIPAFRRIAKKEAADNVAWLQAIFDDCQIRKNLDFAAADVIDALYDGNELRFPALNIDADSSHGRARLLGYRFAAINGQHFTLKLDAKKNVEIRLEAAGRSNNSNVYRFTIVREIDVESSNA